MAALVLKVLGDFAAFDSDGRVIVIAAKKNRALLLVLALAPNGSVAREKLADLLWSDRGPEQARSSLRQALVALRKVLAALEPLPLKADDERVRLDLGLVQVDALKLLDLSKSSNAEDLAAAATLCTGEMLDDLQVSDPSFEHWIGGERRKWHDLSIRVLEAHGASLKGQDKVDVALRLVALEPLREALHLNAMQAYVDVGERAQALQQYETCKAVLARELGVAPGAAIEAMRRDLLAPAQTTPVAPTNPPSGARARRPVATAEHTSIAVFPFGNLSGDPEQRYFSDGFSEDIITELSRFPSLFVIARNTSFQFRDGSADLSAAAQNLGVRYAVEGSVRRTAGRRVRITAKLIDVERGSQLWGERYDRDLDDLFQVQDDVVRTIAATLFGRLEEAEIGGAKRKPTASLAAYDTLLRGIEHIRGYGADDNRLARELFERTVALDPDYALARAYLGLSLLVENRYGSAPDVIKAQALEHTLQAVRLQPGEGRCHQFLALAYRFSKQYDLALQHFERAVALNPNDANAIAHLGSTLAVSGRAQEGLQMIRQAMLLNPRHPNWYWGSLAIAYYATQQYQESLEANWKLGPDKSAWQSARVAACLARLGRIEEANKQAKEVLRLQSNFRISIEMPHYKFAADAEHLAQAMRQAGLPS